MILCYPPPSFNCVQYMNLTDIFLIDEVHKKMHNSQFCKFNLVFIDII